jgi:hypothetical protein
MARQQRQRMVQIAAGDGVVDRRYRAASRGIPVRCDQVQAGQVVRMLAGQLRTQVTGEQAVVPIAAGFAFDGREEQVGRVQLLEPFGAVGALHQRVAQGRVHMAQDAGAQQELAHRRGQCSEHVVSR